MKEKLKKILKNKWFILLITLIVCCGIAVGIFTCSNCNSDLGAGTSSSSSESGSSSSSESGSDSSSESGSDSSSESGGDSSSEGGDGSVEQAESIFSGESTAYIFTENYVLSQKDVEATNGTGKVVVLDYVCTFDLGDNELDLNGYTLQIVSQEVGCVIELKKGTIKNGTLNISVPNGDIMFNDVKISKNVEYELEAASSTIRFSNARISGKGKVKSETRVEIEYSSVASITLEGNGTLNAGSGATLGSVEVSENASGASVNISSKATVAEMAISAAASVEIAGEVSSVKVNGNVKATENVSVTVASTAKVDKVELKAAAKVDVAGEVLNVIIAETATSDEKTTEVNVASTAKVQKLDVQAKAEVKVEGGVENIVVNEKASGTKVNVSGTNASVTNIAINSEDVKVESEKAETINKVIVAEEIKDKVEVSENVTVETATKEEMEEYLKHEHVYTLKDAKLPTCEEAGVATRVCDCGEQYEESFPAKGHNYSSKITFLPTEKEKGVRTYTCENCNQSYTETIPALGTKLESVSELLSAWIGDGTYSIVLEEGSNLVIFRDYFGDINRQEKYQYLYTVELTEAVVDVEDGYPTGHLKVLLSGEMIRRLDSVENSQDTVSTEDTEHDQAEVFIYLDGAYVYVETVSDNNQHSSFGDSDVFFDAILRSMFGYGFTSDELLALVDANNKLESYMVMYKPMVEKFLESIKNVDSKLEENGKLKVEAIRAFLEEYCLTVTEESNGDVAYELDLEEFAEYLLKIGGMKGKEAFDEAYGENAFDTLMGELKTLPDMKLKTIADRVITICESYEIEVDVVFSTIETLVYGIYGVEIDFEAKLESYYENTLADIIVMSINEANLAPGTVTVEEAKVQYNVAYECIKNYAATYTVDQLLNIYFYGEPNYVPNAENGGEEVFSCSKQLKAFVEEYNDKATVIITLNDGSLKAIELALDGLMHVEYANHSYTIAMEYSGYQATLTGNLRSSVDKANLEIKQGAEVVYNGELKIDWENMSFTSVLKNGETILGEILLDLYEDGAWESFHVEIAGVGDLTFHYNADNTYSLIGTHNGYEVSITSVIGSDEGNVIVVIKNGEDELYNGKVTLNVEEMTLEGLVKAVDQVLVQIIADVNDQDSDHSIDMSVNVDEYTFDVEGSKEESKLSAILKNGENEMLGATLQATENEGAMLVITYAGEEVVKIDTIGKEIEDFSTTITYGTGEFTFVINVSVTELEDGVYEIKLDMADAIRRYDYENNAYVGYDVEGIFKVRLTETAAAYTCELDVYLACENYVGYDTDETLVLVDGSLIFSANKNEEGNVEILTLKAAIDRYLGYVGYWYDSEAERVYYENYATVNGTLTIDLESELVIDKEEAEDVVSNFDIFKEMNLTDGLGYLQYEESENGGYYILCQRYSRANDLTKNGDTYEGWVEYETYTAIIPSLNGLPALRQFNYSKDCGDWYYVYFDYEGEVEYQYKRVYGTFERKTRDWYDEYYEIVKQTSEESYYRYTTRTSVYMSNYYNVVTKESAERSQHNYQHTGELLSGSIDCDDGIKVTAICVNCKDTYSWTCYGCYRKEKQRQTLKTQCGDVEVYEYACVCCGIGDVRVDSYAHSWEYHRNEAITADALTALGLSAEGFYYGEVGQLHCYECGLKRMDYTYYTYSATKGCLRHLYVKFDYAGNEDYAAGNVAGSAVNYGHYERLVHTEFTNDLIAEAKALIGCELTFTPTSGYKYEDKCLGCGLTAYVNIDLGDGEGKSIYIHQYYNDKGEFSELHYCLYDLNYVIERAGEYAPTNANYGYIYIYLNEDKTQRRFELYLSSENSNVYISGYEYMNYCQIQTRDYENCREINKYIYFDADGNVTSIEEYESELHSYEYSYYVEGACCTEDGRYYGRKCIRCDATYDGYAGVSYSHRGMGYFEGRSLSDCADSLTQSENLGNATVRGWHCSLCGKMGDVTIVLQDNWTLQNDVYLYAEGIIIDFNGYTLDLNGYNFIVYGFNGSKVVFTDNTYDTSSPEENDNGVIDSSEEKSGCLVAFTYWGDITFGTIAMDANYYISSTDDRETIERSFLEDCGESLDGYHALS